MTKCKYCEEEEDLENYCSQLDEYVCMKCIAKNNLVECNSCNGYGEPDILTSDNDENGDANLYICGICTGKELDYDELIDQHEKNV